MRNTLILLLIALAVGAYVYVYEYKGEEQRQKIKEREEKLIAPEKEEISAWEIYRGGDHYKFVREDGHWRITEPVSTGAEDVTVDGFLRDLTSAKKIRTIHVTGKDKTPYGLKRPEVRIRVEAGAEHDSVFLGASSSFGDNIFAGKGDSVVFLTGAGLKRKAQKSLFDWRDKKALHFEKDAVRRIVLKSPRGAYEFKKAGVSWKLTRPVTDKADLGAVRAMLNKLDYANVLSIEAESAEDKKSYDLDKPAYVIELYQGENQSRSAVAFSAPRGKMAYGKDEARPQIFKVDTLFLEPFNKSLFAFREKKLTDFGTASIRRVTLLNDGVFMEFKKDTSSRWIGVNDTLEARDIKVTTLISAVSGLRAASFVAEKPKSLRRYGLEKPAAVVELFIDDKPEVRLEFGKVHGDRRYVRDALDGRVVTVKEKDLEDILLTHDQMYKTK